MPDRVDDGRAVVIIGSGPSAEHSVANFRAAPPNPLICRINHFYADTRKLFGQQFNDWYFAAADEDMCARVASLRDSGEFSFERIVTSSPNSVAVSFMTDVPIKNPWLALAAHPVFCDYYLRGRRANLPTSGLQALHFYLSEGFREVLIIGFDFYSSAGGRYAFADAVSQLGVRHRGIEGYESNKHSLETDLIYLKQVVQEYPDCRISVSADPTVWTTKILPFLRSAIGPSVDDNIRMLPLSEAVA
jgi:hypothetical protein